MNKADTSERVAVYIDGNNFFGYLKDKEIAFPKGVKFDYKKLVEFLIDGRTCISKRYYVGIARNVDGTEKSRKIVLGQQKFLANLQNDGFDIKRGRVIYDSAGIREKGTDVKIAVDLVVGAVDDIYDTAIVVSSDTDLIPALNYVKYKHKRLEYVGFAHAPSYAMKNVADAAVLLHKEDVAQYREV